MNPHNTSQLQLAQFSGSSALDEVCEKVGRYSPHKRFDSKSVRVEAYRELPLRMPPTPEVLPLLSPRFFNRRPSPPRGETTHGRFFAVPHATFDVCDRAAYQRNKARQKSQWTDAQPSDFAAEETTSSSRPASPRVVCAAAPVASISDPTDAPPLRAVPAPPPLMLYADRALPMLDREKSWLLGTRCKKEQESPATKRSPRERLDDLKATRSSRHAS